MERRYIRLAREDPELTDDSLSGPSSGSSELKDFKSLLSLTPSEYVKLLNVTTAKVIAVSIVALFALYHGMILHWGYGVTPCKGLLKDGMYKGDFWQPWGCMMHDYTLADSERCLRYNRFYDIKTRFIFLGDSRIRQHFMQIRAFFNKSTMDPIVVPYHEDMRWESPNLDLQLEFYWSPVMDERYHEILDTILSDPKSPSLLVTSVATHTIKQSNNSQIAMAEFEKNLTAVVPRLEHIAKKTHVWWMQQYNIYSENLHPARAAVTNSAIRQYNSLVAAVFNRYWRNPESGLGGSGNVALWTSVESLVLEKLEEMEDGIHAPVSVLEQAMLMILNDHCNDNMNFDDGTCCKSSDDPTSIQIFTFGFFLVCMLIFLLDLFYRWCCSHRSSTLDSKRVTAAQYFYSMLTSGSSSPLLISSANSGSTSRAGSSPSSLPTMTLEDFRVFLWATLKLGLIMAYFYICDRTNFFMKENKYFTPLNFWLPVLYVFILGIFFHDESKGTRFMHREQTDEWKGWMQLVILIYHMTGASQALPIYMHMRVLVSSYVFLNAYGHFFFVWLRGQTGLERFVQVLFRMNFLTVLLCLVMNRPYQAYYFVPLISFWFSFQYLVMAIPPKITAQLSETNSKQYVYLVVKIVAMIAVISVFYMSEVFFEKVFLTRPWKALFVTTDDAIREWWFRWKLDRYSMIFGFVFAFLIALGQRYKLYDDTSKSSLWPRIVGLPVALLCLLGVIGYFIFAWNCKDKVECNEVHPYIAFIPIVSFITLRNQFGCLRTRFSSFFAWFGRFSLELFISQYHIWLAADTHGVLVLIPNYPVVNILLTSFVFVCAAHEINVITGVLLPYFVPTEKKHIFRNFVVFLVVMIPIGIHDGMI